MFLFNHTAPPVKIYCACCTSDSAHPTSLLPYIWYGVSCIDGSPYWRTSGYYLRPLESRTQERPTAGRLPIHVEQNATHSRPLVLADRGLVESLPFAPPYAFRLSEMVNAACKQSTRRPVPA